MFGPSITIKLFNDDVKMYISMYKVFDRSVLQQAWSWTIVHLV